MPTSAHSVVSALLHALLWSAIAQGRTTVEVTVHHAMPFACYTTSSQGSDLWKWHSCTNSSLSFQAHSFAAKPSTGAICAGCYVPSSARCGKESTLACSRCRTVRCVLTGCPLPNPGPAPEASHEAAQPPAPAPAAAQGPGEVAIQSLPYSSGGDGSISTGDGSVTAANATSLGSGLIFNGAGQIVSSGSGFGDSPSTYTGAVCCLAAQSSLVWVHAHECKHMPTCAMGTCLNRQAVLAGAPGHQCAAGQVAAGG
jgi:hypothetical protein